MFPKSIIGAKLTPKTSRSKEPYSKPGERPISVPPPKTCEIKVQGFPLKTKATGLKEYSTTGLLPLGFPQVETNFQCEGGSQSR